MEQFDRAFDALMKFEGGYANVPGDSGGETNWGITRAVARENRYYGEMHDMPKEVAKAIYKRNYWLPVFDEWSYALAFQVFDAAVNSGKAQAIHWLQRAVGTAVDGDIGPKTIAAVAACNSVHIAMLILSERLVFLVSLPNWAIFGRGWSRRIAANMRLVIEDA